MIVISNTSPINYLILIGHLHLLPEMFGQIIIPQAVLKELGSEAAPDEIKLWVSSRPDWLLVETVSQVDGSLADLDEGEREVLSLAREIKADLIIIDERRARQRAKQSGLNFTGTLGILDRARTLIDFPEAIKRLEQTSFRASPRLLKKLLGR